LVCRGGAPASAIGGKAMDKSFCAGLIIGMLGGALLVANCKKARVLLKKSQDEVIDKVDSLIDEKMEALSQKEGNSTDFNKDIPSD